MMEILNPLYKVTKVFIEAPWLALVIGSGLALAGFYLRSKASIVIGGLWFLYGVFETLMAQRILCSGECNIRVDLLLLHPLLVIVLTWGLFLIGRKLLGRSTFHN